MTNSLTNVAVGSARWLLIIGLIATLAVAFSAGLRFAAQGRRLLLVQTSSMIPAFRPGDAIIVEPARQHQLQVGDIVSYHSLRDPAVTVSHRIVAVDAKRNTLTTKGDALTASDPSIGYDAIIGRATAVAPGLGRLIGWFKTPLGLCLAVYLPALIVLSTQGVSLWRLSRSPTYLLYDR